MVCGRSSELHFNAMTLTGTIGDSSLFKAVIYCMAEAVSLFNIANLLPPIEEGALVLTPNQRLASRILTAYGLGQSSPVTEKPAILAIEDWFSQLWRQLVLQGNTEASQSMVLTTHQELMLWEDIITGSEQGCTLMRPAATAQQVSAAYKQLLLWQLDTETIREELGGNKDSQAFLCWLDEFIKRSKANGWLTKPQAQYYLLDALIQKKLLPANKLVLVGFSSLPPLYQQLLSFSDSAISFESPRSSAELATVCCESTQQELQAAAVWAKQQLRDDEHSTVAIVVPELDQLRPEVQRCLQEIFEPEYMLPETGRRATPFNISAGMPLLETPVVAAAMDWLALCGQGLETERVGHLLQAPFSQLFSLENLNRNNKLSQLVVALYELRQPLISHADLRYCAQKLLTDDASQVNSLLQQQAEILRKVRSQQYLPASEWPAVFHACLASVGWPGGRELDSLEFQQLTQWQSCLEKFAQFDEVAKPLDYFSALGRLRAVLARQSFQPKTPDSRLQVLGVLEAAGLHFDSLWLTSMSDKQWPASPSPNAFLPFSLQQRMNMPHASAQRELEYAEELSRQFLGSASKVIVSYPSTVNDAEAHISQLYADMPAITLQELLGRPLNQLLPMVEIRRRHHELSGLESFNPGNAPELDQHEEVAGGSSVFASMSACPFRAFALHRLHIKALPVAQLGLNAADRGTLLHRALELLWKKLKTQRALLSLDETEKQELCKQVIEYACRDMQHRKPKLFGERLKQLEQERLLVLLQNWLAVEMQRSDFIVKHLEYDKRVKFAELEMALRIDRVDQLSDGSWLLIDYKSGRPSINKWWGERPDEPQLPFYATVLAQQEQIGGIAFGQLRHDGCSLKGVGQETLADGNLRWDDKYQNLAGVKGWDALMEYWQQVLERLAGEFIQGEARVTPKQSSTTCTYCDLASVCRVAQIGEAK